MNWFCKQEVIAYCQECGLAYKKEHHGDFTEYCSIHRTPKLSLQRRKNIVISWAEMNWEKLEEQAVKETNETNENLAKTIRTFGATMAMNQNMANQQSAYFGSQMPPMTSLGL